MSSAPRYWREIPYRYRLEASLCERCGSKFYPPRIICPNCKSREMKRIRLPKRGTLVSYSVVYFPPKGFELQTPYVVGLVEIDGVKVVGQITDVLPSELKIGMELEACFRKVRVNGKSGIIQYGIKFRKPEKRDADESYVPIGVR
ncbi:MAG: transcriptional regulator [Thermoproteota archaeon]|nr:MAG: transcriptional regulator [Candidatus Korarchaeota archaeon]RLG54059.1 MAG: transcriptional regulator [Candidatus Korarchaeota archaeon]